MSEIRTDRLVLRRARMDDLEPIHAIMSDPQVMRFWSSPPHRTLDESRQWLMSMVAADSATSDDFVIEERGMVVGKLGCWKLPEIGFLIARDRWGHGVASEAMEAYLRRRRAIGAPSRLMADVDPRNAASLRLLSRHGFRETHRASRTWLVGDEWCDSVYLALDL